MWYWCVGGMVGRGGRSSFVFSLLLGEGTGVGDEGWGMSCGKGDFCTWYIRVEVGRAFA